MSKIQYVLLLVVALVAGIVGGVGSSLLLLNRLIVAQKTPEQVVEKQSPQTAKVIRAERFEVVSGGGKVMVGLGMGDLGPELNIYDLLDGQSHLKLGVLLSGIPYLKFGDKNRTLRAVLALDSDDTPLLEFYDKGGKKRAALALVNGGAELALTSDTNEARLSVEPSPETGWATLDLTSKNPSGQREHEVSLAAYKSGPSLSISSGAGFDVKKKDDPKRAGIELGIGAEGPSVTLKDNDGKERATLGQTALEITRTGSTEKRAASSLVLFDKDGKVIWRAP